MNTPLFRERCNSMLNLFRLGKRISQWQFGDDEEVVIRQLVKDGKIKGVSEDHASYYVLANSTPYQENHDFTKGTPHPLVLELAAESPKNEERLRLYNKNVQMPQS